jgi:hypothetical protein
MENLIKRRMQESHRTRADELLADKIKVLMIKLNENAEHCKQGHPLKLFSEGVFFVEGILPLVECPYFISKNGG